MKCKHKPQRLFSWIVQCPVEGTLLCIGCCDCGESWTRVIRKKGWEKKPTAWDMIGILNDK